MRRASIAGAGMLAPSCELETSEHLIFDLGCNSVEEWRQIIDGLKSSVALQAQGSLVVAHGADDPVRMAEAFAQAVAAGRAGYEAGLMQRREMAAPSTPVVGTPFWSATGGENG